MPIQFDYPDVWAYYQDVNDPQIKAQIEQEIIGEGWLYRQTAKTQEKVLNGAPENFIKSVAPKLKPEVAVKFGINAYLQQWRESMSRNGA